MKYSQTARTLSVVFHGIIAAAFGCLGFYFGFFVVPESFNPGWFELFTEYLFSGSYLLYLELAVIGLSLFVISVLGLLKAIASINQNSDEKLVESFSCFIAEGWIVALFFFLQAALLFNLTDPQGTSTAFVIIASLLISIILLIATNIPMVKLFDGKDSEPLIKHLALGAGITFAVIAVLNILALPGLYSYSVQPYTRDYALQLWTMIICSAIPAGILLAAALKKGTSAKIANIGIGVSGSVIGIGMLIVGSYEVMGLDTDGRFYSLLTSNLSSRNLGYGYPVMLLIIGALLVIGALAYVGYSFGPKAKKEAH